MIGDVQPAQPEERHRGQDAALVGDRCRQHPIKGADAIGGDDDQAVAEVVDVADFALSPGIRGDVALEHGVGLVPLLRFGEGARYRRFGKCSVIASRMSRTACTIPTSTARETMLWPMFNSSTP